MDVCTTLETATWKYYYDKDPEAKTQKKKFSQVNIGDKVKLAFEKNAAEAEKKAAEAIEATKKELVQQGVDAALAACRNDFVASVNTLSTAIIDRMKENPDKTT